MSSMAFVSFCSKLVLNFWLPLLNSFDILLLIIERVGFHLVIPFLLPLLCKISL